MTVREALEKAVAMAGKNAKDEHMAGDFTVGECRRILALLKAAKDFHMWSDGGDDDSFYSTRDALLNAIHQMEAE